ncbi:hypothetical protein MR829_18245 [Paracoccus versutus]|uniref:hypothetical protein n=1 Tax=Paracoccus versutus TaxID=34007 RepID=UPI001FB67B5C|nr:hypothetical protein [Paracoccus versutus]MCJ1902305.1 hypothetical protein [Paracoccus versutus]
MSGPHPSKGSESMAGLDDELRRIWAEKGVPAHRQAEILAEIERLAQPGAKVGPFTMPNK